MAHPECFDLPYPELRLEGYSLTNFDTNVFVHPEMLSACVNYCRRTRGRMAERSRLFHYSRRASWDWGDGPSRCPVCGRRSRLLALRGEWFPQTDGLHFRPS